MPTYSLRKQAERDIEEIVEFTIEKWGIVQAGKYVNGLIALFSMLADRPMIGRPATRVRSDLRRIEHGSHIVFYVLVTAGIRIERILHKSRAMKKSDF